MRVFDFLPERGLRKVVDRDIQMNWFVEEDFPVFAKVMRDRSDAYHHATLHKDILTMASVSYVKADQQEWRRLVSVMAGFATTKTPERIHLLGRGRKIQMVGALHAFGDVTDTPKIAATVLRSPCGDDVITVDEQMARIMALMALEEIPSAVSAARDLERLCAIEKAFDKIDCINGVGWAKLVVSACERNMTAVGEHLLARETERTAVNTKRFQRLLDGKDSPASCLDLWDSDSSAILAFLARSGKGVPPSNLYVDGTWL